MKKTLQVLTISKDGREYVCELKSLIASMPDLPVKELRFGTLNELWGFLGQWFVTSSQVADLVDAGLLEVTT